MKVVTGDVQELYQRKVADEFRWALSKGLSIDKAYVEAVWHVVYHMEVLVLVLNMILINVLNH